MARQTTKASGKKLTAIYVPAVLNAAMDVRFPDLGMGVALDIGSKVATGEMKWG
jgi:hypothetical protein